LIFSFFQISKRPFVRYFITLSYLGTHYNGWQRQPNASSVQQTLEEAMTTICRKPIELLGCGRTDTGVHAKHYVAHFDWEDDLPINFVFRLNGVLPYDIAVQDVVQVAATAHARFDAISRSYEYYLCAQKSPFTKDTVAFYPHFRQTDWEKVQAAATLLLDYQEFAPFCKSNHDALTMRCALTQSEWHVNQNTGEAVYYISGNRFLRGMVRLIVGASLHIGLGKLTMDDLCEAMEHQKPLPKPQSAFPQGLFLTNIIY
jgi:tRNA pseudouridine38-40 synthase